MNHSLAIDRAALQADEVIIAPDQVFHVIQNALSVVDERLCGHSERVAYAAMAMRRERHMEDQLDAWALLATALLQDIGSYETDENRSMLDFDSDDAWSHSITGYLFLKAFTPLGNASEAVLFHHARCSLPEIRTSKYADYAAIVNVAGCADILANLQGRNDEVDYMKARGDCFDRAWTEAYARIRANDGFADRWLAESHNGVLAALRGFNISYEDALDYLQMLMYAIDFRSHYTVVHTVFTTIIAVELAYKRGLTEHEIGVAHRAALLHDIGKLAVPVSILEKPGGLTEDEWRIMRSHASNTERILHGVVSDEICNAAARHHERLDGSGYPHGLRSNDLSEVDKLLAIADAMSALCQERSYKPAYPKGTVTSILKEQGAQGKLDPVYCQLSCDNYDSILKLAARSMQPILELYDQLLVDHDALMTRFCKHEGNAPRG